MRQGNLSRIETFLISLRLLPPLDHRGLKAPTGGVGGKLKIVLNVILWFRGMFFFASTPPPHAQYRLLSRLLPSFSVALFFLFFY